MPNKQEAKIEYNGNEVFFFQYDFKSAMQHAQEFIERNKGKFEMKLFILNTSNFGPQWLFQKRIK